MDGQSKLELFPSLREEANEFKQPFFPDWTDEDFDEDFFPNVSPGWRGER